MKLTAFILTILCLHVSAAGFSQKIAMTVKNKPLTEVFSFIEQQSGYKFFYDNKVVKKGNRVTINVRAGSVQEIMDEVMKGQPMTFSIIDKTIVIKKKPEGIEAPQSVVNPVAIDMKGTGYSPARAAIDKRMELILMSKTGEPEKTDLNLKGKVTDEKGEGLPGVSVVMKGSQRGTTTDADGSFQLEVPESNAVLIFSFVGYMSKEVAVGSQTSIDVSLQTDNRSLNEIVVVGYGTVKKSDLTGSLSQVKSKELNAYPATNVLQALSGRAAGVQVLQNTGAPGGGISVRIRGTNSLRGSNEPLYVVDGFPISGSNPTILNNADIESMEVLKDASATAIYGSRGANGVILITSKQGKSGKTRVDFETSYSEQKLRKKLDMMNATEYATFYNEQAANDKLNPYFTQAQIDGMGEGFDWQNLIFRQTSMKTTALNVSGGNEKTNFSISGSTFNQDGIVKGSDYNRYSLRTNISHTISKKFSVNFAGTLSRLVTSRKDSEGGGRGTSMISSAIGAPPSLTPYNADGSYRILATAYPFVATDLINPINFINEQNNKTKANVALLNAAFIFKPIEELTIKIAGGIENRDDRSDNYTSRNFVRSSGAASVSTGQFTSLLSENTISYNKTIREKHNIAAVAGFTYQDFLSTALSGSGVGFLSNVTETYDLSSAATPGIPRSDYTKSVLLSYLARLNYSFDSRYLATISIRRDGASKYSEGDKWGYFPSAALAWRVSSEEFLKNNPLISDLKLRASWGRTGSQAIDAYATLNQLNSGKTVFGDALYSTYGPGTTLPGNLKWETTEQKNVGVDLGILKNRLIVTADYYVKNTRDLLNSVPLPSSLGYSNTIRNIGEVQNKGFELGLDGRILTGEFKWDMNANISFNRNKVVKLNDGLDVLGGNVNVVVINDVTNILREGRPIGQFWGYVEDGYDEKGKIKYKDTDGDGSITIKDKTYIGNPNPDFIYGINSSMSYKNFDLVLFVQGVSGNELFNTSGMSSTIDYGFGLNMPKEVYQNHWTPSNTNAKYPIISNSVNARVSNRYLEDGSYLRLKNIQLAYNFPLQKWEAKWIRTAQLYASAQNLLTLTKYSWWDPEVNSKGGSNSTMQGVDFYSYPIAKTVTIGLRVGF
ncbi:TonB-dependent receptor [Dyadobacter sp. LHD-138]|uniref:TonB-dependent receptor n=1 Tax=Dyadobacter sp. LHD-138 TaxID=3071413 RepID=UPI0027E0D3AA|nr:TonB-dependent receptor [Dyadobacter sp. LHD-138]MDQ6481681.1 TonB-dependent receptor [Dyadobacter sp. LHD-138]